MATGNSQKSNFDDASDLMIESFSAKEEFSYESMLATTKEAFHGYKNETKKSTFPTYFATVLGNSLTCIQYGLEEQIRRLLSDSTVPINKIVGYLNDATILVQLMLDLYKSIIELVSMSCCSMKTLPIETALIILSVFEHCRDSENLYGPNLSSVEKQLKELFRVCHELQHTYLLILEKYFNFDLTEPEHKNILVEALKINLSIGKVVQSLDVKTMAQQWKTYTLICEKYSSNLSDTDIILECSQVLVTLIKENVGNLVEKSQDDKILVRSLKVASFTIKILLKMCIIFRQSSSKNFNHIVDLLHYIYLEINNAHGLKMSGEKSVASLMNINVGMPSSCLLKELLSDEQFVDCLLKFISKHCDDEKNNDGQLGMILLIASAVKCTSQENRTHQYNLKTKLVNCIYSFLPTYSLIWFRRRLILTESNRSYSAFEHLLINTTALALTMTNDEFNALETNMIEAILSTECVSALFSSELWLLLARQISPQLLFNQLIWLCTMYKKLGVQNGFYRSPQDIHLTHTISRLFKVIDDEEKLKICKQFRIHDEDNISLWTAIQIRNLPLESQGKAEEAIAEKLKTVFKRLHESDSADLLIDVTSLAATCMFETTRGIDDHLVKAWSKVCQENQPIVLGLDYYNTVWFYDYVKSLTALTFSAADRLRERSDNFIKVLHVIHGLIRTGDTEMKLILTNTLCKLATHEGNEHRNIIDSHCTEAFMSLLQDSDGIVQDTCFRALRCYRHNKYLDSIVGNITNDSLQWHNYMNDKCDIDSKEFIARASKYSHKCLERKNIEMSTTTVQESSTIQVQELNNANLDDFYFDSGGSEMVETEEPSSKRGKTNAHEPDSIIRSLEENVLLLSRQTVYTPNQLTRIQNVCEKLKNISH